MVALARLAGVSLYAQNISQQTEFYNDRWGLGVVDDSSGEVYLRAESSRHHVLSLHESDRAGLRSILFEVSEETDLARTFDELSANGVEVTAPRADPAPGISAGLTLKDLDGNVVELVQGIAESPNDYGFRDVKPMDVNHVVLDSPDPTRLAQFYMDNLGFWMNESTTGIISFYACNRNHHSLAIATARDGVAGLNHVAWELQDRDAWLRALYFAGERKIKRLFGPGRHGPGDNLFCYYHDEEGNTMEYTAEVIEVEPGTPPKINAPGTAPVSQWPEVDGH